MDARGLIAIAIAIAIAGCSGANAVPDAGLVPDARPDVVPPVGLVAWFNLNNSLADSSDNQLSMQVGGPLDRFFTDGVRGGGAYMDGVTQYALLEATSAPDNVLDFAGAFTIALWVRPERTPTDFEVFASRSFGSAADSSYSLAIDSTLRLRFDSQGGSSLVGSTPLALGEWTHVALTYDGADKHVFVNGELDGSGPAAAPVTWDHAYLFFGADEEQSVFVAGHRLKGSLDDVMLFDRALDPSEITALAAH